MTQLTFLETTTEKPERKPKAIVTVWYHKPDRLPRIYRQEAVYFSDPKQMAMEMLIGAASGVCRYHKAKPSQWKTGMRKIPYAIASILDRDIRSVENAWDRLTQDAS